MRSLGLDDREVPSKTLNGSTDLKGAALKINVSPVQSEQLTLPHSGRGGEDVKCFEPITCGSVLKLARLLG